MGSTLRELLDSFQHTVLLQGVKQSPEYSHLLHQMKKLRLSLGVGADEPKSERDQVLRIKAWLLQAGLWRWQVPLCPVSSTP